MLRALRNLELRILVDVDESTNRCRMTKRGRSEICSNGDVERSPLLSHAVIRSFLVHSM